MQPHPLRSERQIISRRQTFLFRSVFRERLHFQTEQIRRRLEREAHLEAQYRDLFESASDAVFTLDAGGGVTAMNLAGRSLTAAPEVLRVDLRRFEEVMP